LKLITKLTVFNTLSKLAIVLLFVVLLPLLVNSIASQYTNFYLRQQKEKVLQEIDKNGIDYYLQGQENYGSYTMLKEEYVSLEPGLGALLRDTIETSLRVVENDTLIYRVLRHSFVSNNNMFVLEVGKTTSAINQFSDPLQRVALWVLAGLVFITILLDLLYARFVLKPLNTIISTRLLNSKFPFPDKHPPVRSTTSDFVFLDRCIVELMEKIKETFDKEREFTSNASHELMTPISVLQNKLENLMVEGDFTEEQLQHKVMGMMTTVNRLKKIVRSLLLISRIENNQFAKTDIVNIGDVVNEVVNELSERIEAHNLTIRINITPELQAHRMNHDLIFQLLYNLINNAIRYNKASGEINITAKNSDGVCVLSIADTGIGIQPGDLDAIFYRFKKSTGAAEDGYGLGLSIVKSIAEYHSLSIDVKSVVGEGTIFTVSFPRE
jgi:two-component system, OmpR family, sensor histidine kinase ArlS